MFSRELKKGSTELLILALLEERDRHGYDIGKLIEQRSGGQLRFRIGSLYPMLVRLEDRGYVKGRWVESETAQRRRYYRLTTKGKKFLAAERSTWEAFTAAVTTSSEFAMRDWANTSARIYGSLASLPRRRMRLSRKSHISLKTHSRTLKPAG
jgi:transcriptional regulator